MPDAAHRVRLEGIDLDATFPVLRLFSSFRMALQPAKLLLALLLLLLIYFGGAALDVLWGSQTKGTETYRVFASVLHGELTAFSDLIRAAARLDFGVGAVAGGATAGLSEGGGVLGALYRMVVEVPGWAWVNHPCFFVLLTGWGLVVSMVLGGGIARLAAVEVCHGQCQGVPEASRFVTPRAMWLVLTPLIPLFVVALVWVGLAVAGGVLFNVPGLNVLGGLGYGVMLLAGLLATVILIFTGLGVGLLPAAIAVEGTDAFDAVSRVFTFLICRTLRCLALFAVVLVYGALTTVLVGVVVFGALWFTRGAAGVWTSGLADAYREGGFGRLPSGGGGAEG
ncbi:MAG: hypothetical protein V3V20_09050, partial [Algisphaera sp.]